MKVDDEDNMNKMIDMFKDIYEKYKELREQYLKATAEDNWDLMS